MRKITGLFFLLLTMILFPGAPEMTGLIHAAEEDICDIYIENVTLMERNTHLQEVENLVNEITIPRIGCRVKIVDCPIPEHEKLMGKIQAGITQVDLVETGLTTSLSSLVSAGLLLPLNGLLDEYGTDLRDMEGRLLQATTIDGTIYAVPAGLYYGRADGIGYNADLAKAYEIAVPDPVTLEELTEIGIRLRDAGSGIYLTTQGDGRLTMFDSFYETESFSGGFAYGVIMNPEKSTEVVNLFATEEYREYLHLIRSWYEAGLIPADSLVSGRNGQDMFNQQEIFFQYSSVSPQTKIAAKKKGLSFEERFVPAIRNRLTTGQVQEFAWGITAGCEHPEKAMELLNLIYTEPLLSNILQYGLEDVDYEVIREGVIRPLEPEKPEIRYSSYFTIFGDTARMYRYETDTDISVEDIRAFTEAAEDTATFGYVFRSDPVQDQVTAVRKIISNYMPVLETGVAEDVDSMLDLFIQELNQAGIGDIIAENQRQLDQWLEQKVTFE